MERMIPLDKLTERDLVNARVRDDLLGLLPASAVEQYVNQAGTYLGSDLADVVAFALLSWLHENSGRLPRE